MWVELHHAQSALNHSNFTERSTKSNSKEYFYSKGVFLFAVTGGVTMLHETRRS